MRKRGPGNSGPRLRNILIYDFKRADRSRAAGKGVGSAIRLSIDALTSGIPISSPPATMARIHKLMRINNLQDLVPIYAGSVCPAERTL